MQELLPYWKTALILALLTSAGCMSNQPAATDAAGNVGASRSRPPFVLSDSLASPDFSNLCGLWGYSIEQVCEWQKVKTCYHRASLDGFTMEERKCDGDARLVYEYVATEKDNQDCGTFPHGDIHCELCQAAPGGAGFYKQVLCDNGKLRSIGECVHRATDNVCR